MRIHRLPAIAIFIVASTICAQTIPATAPATAAKTTPVEAPDLSTPNGAVLAFLRASAAGDSKTMLSFLTVDAPRKPLLESLAITSASSARLLSAMEARFGVTEVSKIKLRDAVPNDAELHAVAAAKPALINDDATLTVHLAAGSEKTYELTRIKGAWLIDAGKTMHLPADADTIKSLQVTLAATIDALNETRVEVESGKWGSAVSAQRSLQEKLLHAANPETKPATTTPK